MAAPDADTSATDLGEHALIFPRGHGVVQSLFCLASCATARRRPDGHNLTPNHSGHPFGGAVNKRHVPVSLTLPLLLMLQLPLLPQLPPLPLCHNPPR